MNGRNFPVCINWLNVIFQITQAVVGHSSSSVHSLWRQLWALEQMLVILRSSWKHLRSIDKLPKYPSPKNFLNDTVNGHGGSAKATVSEQLKTLFSGAFSAHHIGQNDKGSSMFSVFNTHEVMNG